MMDESDVGEGDDVDAPPWVWNSHAARRGCDLDLDLQLGSGENRSSSSLESSWSFRAMWGFRTLGGTGSGSLRHRRSSRGLGGLLGGPSRSPLLGRGPPVFTEGLGVAGSSGSSGSRNGGAERRAAGERSSARMF